MSDLGTISQNQGNNAKFIEAARTAMPALLGFVEDMLAVAEAFEQQPDTKDWCGAFAQEIRFALADRLGGA